MTGMQDSLKDGLTVTPLSDNNLTPHGAPIPVPAGDKSHRGTTSPSFGNGKEPSIHSTSSVSRSWGESLAPGSAKAAVAFSSAGHLRRPIFSQITNPRVVIPVKKVLVFDEIAEERSMLSHKISFLLKSNFGLQG